MANASLLDEGTAAGEAMALSFHNSKDKKKIYVVDANLHPQTVDVIKSRAENIGVEIVEIPLATKQGLKNYLELLIKSVVHWFNIQIPMEK